MNKEIKSAKTSSIRVFKKDCAVFRNNTLIPELKSGKAHKIKNSAILKYRKDIFSFLNIQIEKNILKSKILKQKGSSIFLRPFLKFIYLYLFKGAIFEGKRGLIYAIFETLNSFIIQTKLYEDKNNDI